MAKSASVAEEVAAHYDNLDRFYREIWGEHVHHGLWETGRESPEEATLLLSKRMAELAEIRGGERVCDIGCGYGGTSRFLANNYGARVLGLTLSQKQFSYAKAQKNTTAGPELDFLCEDFLTADLPKEGFDALISIECIEHMADKQAFFEKAYSLLPSGGRFAFAVWTSAESASEWQKRSLLDPICKEGRMPDLPRASEWRRLIEDAGFKLTHQSDVAQQVKKTWAICCRRLIKNVLVDPSYRQFLWSDPANDKVFALTLFRLYLAFETKAMRYWLFAGKKP